MAELSSMSEYEILAVMKEQEHKKQEATRKFLDFHSSTHGAVACHFWKFWCGCSLTPPPPVQSTGATLQQSFQFLLAKPRWTTALQWHSSAWSQMDCQRCCSLRTRSTQPDTGPGWTRAVPALPTGRRATAAAKRRVRRRRWFHGQCCLHGALAH
jgi:hypothetical protein